jgi:LysR family glycine cleavage system transcriptional activator
MAPDPDASQMPPLTALRTFEAAARHLSFTRAAQELCVTQTAVSHQVKQLEAHLGVALFRRGPRQLALTEDGQAWAREMRQVFTRLFEANRRLRARARVVRPVLAVTVIPSIAGRWLVPRLGRFLSMHPDVDVHISPDPRVVDLSVEPFDVAIRFGRGPYPGLVTEKLAGDAFVVVSSPSLRARRKLVSPEDLRHQVLLRDDEVDAWPRWLARNGVRGVDGSRGSMVTDSSMLVAAAVEGQGVALARRSLTADDLASGRLVMPFPRSRPLASRRAYFLVAPRESLRKPYVKAFWTWVLEEGATLR